MIDLTKEITSALRTYTNEVTEGLERAKEDNARAAVKELKGSSPKGDYKGGGKYAKGWRAKQIGNTWVVHNATDYQLTHLLEKGHANRDGSRTQAYPHIGPAEDMAIVGYLKQMEKVIRG